MLSLFETREDVMGSGNFLFNFIDVKNLVSQPLLPYS